MDPGPSHATPPPALVIEDLQRQCTEEAAKNKAFEQQLQEAYVGGAAPAAAGGPTHLSLVPSVGSHASLLASMQQMVPSKHHVQTSQPHITTSQPQLMTPKEQHPPPHLDTQPPTQP
ncbi:hypothetical protein LIER_17839 [Lithospermum erythrorhizon]|uniref:Uncharacterized protein n=1 Tax=Lithospermum erythrorhizon TaxID=34254 RepID=A0AAV3QFZ7_LITER